MFFVSRQKYDDLERSRQALINDLSNSEKRHATAKQTLITTQDLCDQLMAKYTTTRADNEALLRFAAAVKAAMDKLANELAEISGQIS